MKTQKQKLDSLFDLSIILDKIKCIEEQQQVMLHLTKRPVYSISEPPNTSVQTKIINDTEIKLRFKQIQRESNQSWKPQLMRTQYCKPFLRPLHNFHIMHSPKRSDANATKKPSGQSQKSQTKQSRSKSTDHHWHFQKTESIDIEAQFNETKNLIRRFNKVNRVRQKQVRFDMFT